MLAFDRATVPVATTSGPRWPTLTRLALITAALIAPPVVIRIVGRHADPVAALLIYGAAVVSASVLLAWAAEAAQIEVSGDLAIAVLALVAAVPKCAVDLYCVCASGHRPNYAQYGAATMTGYNRLLMGLGWPIVVLISVVVARKVGVGKCTGLALEHANRVELGFLLTAGVVAFVIPASGQIHLVLELALLA
ncbi:hypothetical protein B586_01980 [Mycobacterium haemophilum DSM 44634]|nr:hypothetical protein B586_01980 [Mycobacterium haemophilum DSM 44634]